MYIHPIFYILFLKPVDPEISVQIKPTKLSSENEYKVERIINYNPEN